MREIQGRATRVTARTA